MPCYAIPYVDSTGEHVTTKWGNSTNEVLALAKKALRRRQFVVFGTPRIERPQPFSDERRESFRVLGVPSPAESVHQVDFSEMEEDPSLGSIEGMEGEE